MNRQQLKKLGLLGSLYVSQYIPITFLYETLPIFLRQQGLSLRTIGLLNLLALPLIFKFLWSPFIDRYGFTRWGHYRVWIFGFQILLGGTTIALAFIDVSSQFQLLLAGALLISVLSASQDIATDALAVGLLPPQERGFGNGVQRGGNALGAVIGGGGMLLLLSFWGWQGTLLGLAGLILLALIPLMRHREIVPQKPAGYGDLNAIKGYFKTLTNFCRRPQIGGWLLVLVTYAFGPYMASTMFRPLLVDVGLSLADIGLLLGVISYSAGFAGALVAGLLITQLGRKRSLLIFGSLQVGAIATYLLPVAGFVSFPMLSLVAITNQVINSMATTTLFTIMMDKSQVGTAGTDYTVQSSIAYLSGVAAAVISGIVAQAIGYPGLFGLSMAIALASILVVFVIFQETNTPQLQPNQETFT
ncbi:MAG: MFS transporter [Cyanobacteria bacterium P01_D01_bin.71]